MLAINLLRDGQLEKCHWKGVKQFRKWEADEKNHSYKQT